MIDRVKGWLHAADEWSTRHRTARITRRAVSGFMAHEALNSAGSMAYFAVLSLFQLLVLGVVIGSFIVGEGQARDFIVEQVEAGSPLEGETIGGVIDSIIESRGGMSIISIAFLLWGSLGLFSAMSTGIARVFENAPPRPFIKDKVVGLLLIGLTGALAIASLAIGIITGILQEAARGVLEGLPGGGIGLWLIGLLAPIILIFVAFWVIYRVVPNRPVSWREVLPGAVVATILWTILRFGFTYYATNIANYESAFGPLSTAITLIVFLYFASIVVLLGAEFARASALDDEMGMISTADPRFLPVPQQAVPAPAPEPSKKAGGLPRWVPPVAAALLGLVIGRITKRDEY